MTAKRVGVTRSSSASRTRRKAGRRAAGRAGGRGRPGRKMRGKVILLGGTLTLISIRAPARRCRKGGPAGRERPPAPQSGRCGQADDVRRGRLAGRVAEGGDAEGVGRIRRRAPPRVQGPVPYRPRVFW